MKVTSLELQWGLNQSKPPVVLSFRDPKRLSPYNVKGITGLDADEIIPQFYLGGFTEKFYQLSMMKREIVVLLQLNPNFNNGESYSDLRDNLYKMISAHRTGIVKLVFKEGSTEKAYLTAHIIKFEAPQFNKVHEVQITLRCVSPWLYGMNEVVVSGAGLSEAAANIPDNESTAPHGFRWQINVLATRSTFIMNDPTDESWIFQFSPQYGLLNGDQLLFSSEPDNKYVRLVRAGVTYGMADVIHFGSTFPILFPGDNNFAIDSPSSFNWIGAWYTHAYWGI